MTNYSQKQNNDLPDQELTMEEVQEISGSGFGFELVKTFGKEFAKWFAKKGYKEVKSWIMLSSQMDLINHLQAKNPRY